MKIVRDVEDDYLNVHDFHDDVFVSLSFLHAKMNSMLLSATHLYGSVNWPGSKDCPRE